VDAVAQGAEASTSNSSFKRILICNGYFYYYSRDYLMDSENWQINKAKKNGQRKSSEAGVTKSLRTLEID